MIYVDNETKLRVNIYYTYNGFSKLDTPEIREAAGVIEIAEPAAPADYSTDYYYRTEQDAAPYVIYTRKSDEQISQLRMKQCEQAVQALLDAEAIAAGYDSIHTAVTYADEPAVPKFQQDGIALRTRRSLVWAKCYEIMAQVISGNRQLPTVAELISELPAAPISP